MVVMIKASGGKSYVVCAFKKTKVLFNNPQNRSSPNGDFQTVSLAFYDMNTTVKTTPTRAANPETLSPAAPPVGEGVLALPVLAPADVPRAVDNPVEREAVPVTEAEVLALGRLVKIAALENVWQLLEEGMRGV